MDKSQYYKILSAIKQYHNQSVSDKVLLVCQSNSSDDVPIEVHDYISEFYNWNTGIFLCDEQFLKILSNKTQLMKDLSLVAISDAQSLSIAHTAKVASSLITHYWISKERGDILIDPAKSISKLASLLSTMMNDESSNDKIIDSMIEVLTHIYNDIQSVLAVTNSNTSVDNIS